MPVRPVLNAIVFGNSQWFTPVLVGAAVAALLLVASIRATRLPVRWQLLLFSLKFAALAMLITSLLDPQMTNARPKLGENIVVLLVDDSASQQLQDASDSEQSRGERWRDLLTTPDSPWQTRLAQDFDLRRYTFGETLQPVASFQDLQFESPASQIVTSLQQLEQRHRQLPLGAVFLFSDGAATDAELLSTLQLRAPVHVVRETQPPQIRDISIEQATVNHSLFEAAPVTIRAVISHTGVPSGELTVTLTPEPALPDSAPLSQQFKVAGDGEQRCEFELQPPRPGVLFYRLDARASNEAGAALDEEEVTLFNNSRLVAINRRSDPLRVLYVSGRPNWEHKFLNRAVSEDPQVQLISLVRIANKEARFDFRGRAGESSNPLFRGFKENPDEETEAYDQPVLVRLNTRDADELSEGFPREKEGLYAYEGLILDDIEAGFFSHAQQTLIERFVSERGGGLAMLGGRDAFRHGGWTATPVADALPVYLDRVDNSLAQPFRWRFTRDGLLEPWMRLRNAEADEQRRLDALPPLELLSAVGRSKPGARVLAEVVDEAGQASPAVVVQPYGRGRSLAVLPGDLWRWSLKRESTDMPDPARAWRQWIRWLVSDVPARLELQVENRVDGNPQATAIRVRVRDREFQPRDDAPLTLTVRQPDGVDFTLAPQPSLEAPGVWETVFISRQSGGYVCRAELAPDENEPGARVEQGWVSNPTALEFASVNRADDWLAELAQRTGGEVVPVEQLENFAARLTSRPMPVMETHRWPLWHRPGWLAALITLLAAEWGLRRWKGLA